MSLDSFPAFSTYRGVLMFLLAPTLMLLFSKLTGIPMPKPVLYGVAAALGFVLVLRAYYNVELILAVGILYFPFSKQFVVPIAPGLNGTNVFLILMLLAAFFQAQRNRISFLPMLPGTKIILAFFILSAGSALTLWLTPGGFAFFMDDIWYVYKAWLDQFILYFVALSIIRDREVAKRVVIYMAIGTFAVGLFTIPEMLEKTGVSNLDKARLGGPHDQPNNFGGFIAYTLLPVIALFIVYIRYWRAWLVLPYMGLSVKLLIMSFSRGAYLAMAAAGLLTGYLRGKAFLFFWLFLAVAMLAMFPSLIPESIVARISSTEQATSTSSQQLDKSSQTRLIMWEAAIEMTLEDPIIGKGFKAFPMLKDRYTDVYAHESDPHNMYLYVSSQMGIPAMVLFILMFLNMFEMGRKLSRNEDPYIRAIGIGGAGVSACVAIVNIFGSRFINIEFTCYFLILYVVMQFLHKEQNEQLAEKEKERRRKRKFATPVKAGGAAS
ncbi:O-antigen ligase family protein [Granulosicoccaceae sp. 1_MG-2023]|nr:O-antigen ligase family protein [Granulosicoccaceae sp. 1_MG-2023]